MRAPMAIVAMVLMATVAGAAEECPDDFALQAYTVKNELNA